jgi:hypothetical protein
MTDEAMSPLRQRMIKDMTIRKFARRPNMNMCRGSRTSRRFSGDRRIRRASRTCAATSCTWRGAALACRRLTDDIDVAVLIPGHA